jgi:glucoamylase
LTGERAHYALAAGDHEEAERLLTTMESFAGEGGLLPEQVWDAEDLPERELYRGRPSGSAMPLVWAHAEYLKLVRSITDGRVFDCPPQTVARYLERPTAPPPVAWRFNHKIRHVPAARTLRVETGAPSVVHWTADDWQTVADTPTQDRGWGVHVADLPTGMLTAGTAIQFTFRWAPSDRWEGENFAVTVDAD